MSVADQRVRVDWAPDIPANWDVARLRWVSRIFAGGTPDRSNLDFWTDGTIPWLNSGSVNDVAIASPSALITKAAVAKGATRWAPAGSVLVALAGQGRTKGMAARLDFDSTLNQSMAAIVPGPTIEQRYLHYWLTSNYLNLRGLTGGDLRDGLNLQHIGSVQVPRPPVLEQRAIADFLDRETAQIDAFIAKNEELITLLTERRAAAIDERFAASDATESLTVRRVLAVSQTGPFGTQLSADEYVSGGVPVINPTHVVASAIQPDPDVSVTIERARSLGRFQLRTGDIVLGRKGEVDKSAITPAIYDGAICGSDSMLLRVNTRVSAEYLWSFLQSPSAHSQLERFSVGSTVAGLNQQTLRSVRLPVPSPDEQRAVVSDLATLNARVDTAVEAARRGVELARERRRALISAAVTGKISVGVDA